MDASTCPIIPSNSWHLTCYAPRRHTSSAESDIEVSEDNEGEAEHGRDLLSR